MTGTPATRQSPRQRKYIHIPAINREEGVLNARDGIRCHHNSTPISIRLLRELRAITPPGRYLPTGCADCFTQRPVGVLHNCDYLLLDTDMRLFMVCGYCGYESECPKDYAARAVKLLRGVDNRGS